MKHTALILMMSVTHGIYGIVSSQEQNMTKDEGDALIDLCLFETVSNTHHPIIVYTG